MRVLIGFPNKIPELLARRALPGRESRADEILAFGGDYAHVAFAPGMTWDDLRANCPAGWLPDVYIHWSPEYNALPLGLAGADCLTVGVWGDWNLGGQALRAVGEGFDAHFADRNGGDLLRQCGFESVFYAPLWAHDPALHRYEAGAARTIDILMIGNFNHDVQRERSQWLARVARLSRRYRVVLTSGLYGEAYVGAMNRAKIVFNRSIRGEINMRAYEAPACGALLFYEAENPEIAGLYRDREDCVLYRGDNLETLLDYYLAPDNEPERARIALSGHERVQPRTYARHLAGMLDQIEPLLAARQAGGLPERAWERRPRAAQNLRQARQWLLSCDSRVWPALDGLLQQTQNALAQTITRPLEARLERASAPPMQALPGALPRGAESLEGLVPKADFQPCAAAMDDNETPARLTAETRNALAVLCGQRALAAASEPERAAGFADALAHVGQALECEPTYTLARCNRAALLLASGRTDAAKTLLHILAGELDAPDLRASQLRGVCFPHRYTAFDVELERVYGAHTPGSPAWRDALRALLMGRVQGELADMTFAQGDYDAAVCHARRAQEARPTESAPCFQLAQAQRAMGRTEPALQAYRRALDLAPFHVEAWDEATQLLLDLERPQEAFAWLDDWLTILDGCPPYAHLRPHFAERRALAAQAARHESAASATGGRAQADGRADGVTRLLAFPDWSRDDRWQAMVRAFAQTFAPSDPTLLMLRADPNDFPDAQALLNRLAEFLTDALACPADALPNITLLNQPLAAPDAWKLFHVADALIDDGALTAPQRRLAAARALPLRALNCL